MAEAWHTPAYDSCCENGDGLDLVDSDLETAWNHYVVEEHWIILDMGETYSISKMQMYDYHGWGLATDIAAIYVSDDVGNWGGSVGSFVFPNEAGSVWREIDTTDKDGRYIKLVSVSAQLERWVEFQIYGEVAAAVEEQRAIFFGANF